MYENYCRKKNDNERDQFLMADGMPKKDMTKIFIKMGQVI
jgi:hypothetical protein